MPSSLKVWVLMCQGWCINAVKAKVRQIVDEILDAHSGAEVRLVGKMASQVNVFKVYVMTC